MNCCLSCLNSGELQLTIAFEAVLLHFVDHLHCNHAQFEPKDTSGPTTCLNTPRKVLIHTCLSLSPSFLVLRLSWLPAASVLFFSLSHAQHSTYVHVQNVLFSRTSRPVSIPTGNAHQQPTGIFHSQYWKANTRYQSVHAFGVALAGHLQASSRPWVQGG